MKHSNSGFVQVLENLASPGILLWHFPGLESPGKGLLVLESSGNLLKSSKKTWNVWQTVRIINIKIMGVKGLMWILESWKNQSESWKSPGNLFLKKGTNPVTGYYSIYCTVEILMSATFLFLPHFVIICDLLLNRRTTTWNLFVKVTDYTDYI